MEDKEAVKDVARQLNEANLQAIGQIERIAQHLGSDFAYQVLQETFEKEAQGGLLTNDKTRRRISGSVYLYLAYGHAPADVRKVIWPDVPRPRHIPVAPFRWSEREQLVTEIIQDPGEGTVKISLIGRPNKIIQQ